MKKPKLSIVLIILFTAFTGTIAYLSARLPDLFDKYGEKIGGFMEDDEEDF